MSLVVVGPCGGDVFFKAREGLLWWVGMYRMGGKGLIRRENAWVRPKVLLSAPAGAW